MLVRLILLLMLPMLLLHLMELLETHLLRNVINDVVLSVREGDATVISRVHTSLFPLCEAMGTLQGLEALLHALSSD